MERAKDKFNQTCKEAENAVKKKQEENKYLEKE